MFDSVVSELGSQAQDDVLFGHSAGAQFFVHRFVGFVPQHRARVAVVANARWYTIPDDSIPDRWTGQRGGGAGIAPIRSNG